MDPSTTAEVAAAASVDPPSLAPDASSSGAGMTLDERFDLLISIGEECIQKDELRKLLQNKDKPVPICYDGFEPSGRMHVAQVPRNGRTSSFPRPLVISIESVTGIYLGGKLCSRQRSLIRISDLNQLGYYKIFGGCSAAVYDELINDNMCSYLS